MDQRVNVIVDGVNVNATHFAAMSEEDAIKAIMAEGFAPGAIHSEKDKAPHTYKDEAAAKAWAKTVYEASVKEVDRASRPAAKEEAVAGKEAVSTMKEAAKAETGVNKPK